MQQRTLLGFMASDPLLSMLQLNCNKHLFNIDTYKTLFATNSKFVFLFPALPNSYF